MSDEVKIKEYGLTVDFSSDVDYNMKNEMTEIIQHQVTAAIVKFEKTFLQGSNAIEDKLRISSPHKQPQYDEELLPTKDGWCVGYIREFNCVDIYHKHGSWPFIRKWHFAWKGECPECHDTLPSEMWTAIHLLVDL